MTTAYVSARISNKCEITFQVIDGSRAGPITAALEGFEDIRLGNGYGFNQCDKGFYKKYTMAAAGTQDIDLAGTLTDDFGNTVTFTRVKKLLIRSRGTALTSSLSFKAKIGAVPTAFNADVSDVNNIGAGGYYDWYAPFGAAITPGSDTITITNGSDAQDVEVFVIGTSI